MATAVTAYLDHAATTPMRAAAVEAMLPLLTERFANPSGGHVAARDARKAVDEARDVVAACLGCAPGEVVFTGCGTEADNLAIEGVVERHGGTAVCTAVEHHAVLHTVEHVGGRIVGVDATGVVDLEALAAALDDDVRVVSVMLANNEVGTIQPLDAVAAVVAERAPGAWLHTDAVQGAVWLDVAAAARSADLVAVSAHKFGGPKGVGALVVRDGVSIAPMLLGGGQERDRRSGTHNVAGIVAMATALQCTVAEREATVARVGALRDRLVDGLAATVPGLIETVPRAVKVAGSAHVCIEGVESEALLFLLDRAGVCASAASSCSSGAMEPSHVLAAMGVPKEVALGALRLSLGAASTDADVDRALEVIPEAVAKLPAVSVGTVLVAMSGGVDSSVAAALLLDDGWDVVGVTMKLWGGESDTGCCSVSDVDDARRVAQQLGIDHHVFNFGDDFAEHVVAPYVAAHAVGRTPNPCLDCNRHLKFDRLLQRAAQLGIDTVATGHHARIEPTADGGWRLARSVDRAKDQSYVLHMLDQAALTRVRLPLGAMTKADVRAVATSLGLRTAAKPDSQDVCFITSTGGRAEFLGGRLPLHAGDVVDVSGRHLGRVDAVELVTVGQRRGVGIGGGERRYVLDVDVPAARVTVGPLDELLSGSVRLDGLAWTHMPAVGPVLAQCSAHGATHPATVDGDVLTWDEPQRLVAPGQAVVLYDETDRYVLGAGVARREPHRSRGASGSAASSTRPRD